MPNNLPTKAVLPETYLHIFNAGASAGKIFLTEYDYRMFLDFIKDYLNPQLDPESIKKTFVLRGKTYRGLPTRPQNYFEKVELLAYCLKPDHFHLLVREISKGAARKFIRSLSTRYSLYFNRKYHRTGTLYAGPYKAVPVNNTLSLLLLSRYFHFHPKGENDFYSSFPEYRKERKTSWIKINKILFEYENLAQDSNPASYTEFVNRYESDQPAKKAIAALVLDKESGHFCQNESPPASTGVSQENQIAADSEAVAYAVKKTPKWPVWAFSTIVFVILMVFGARNVTSTNAKVARKLSSPTPLAVVAGTNTQVPSVIWLKVISAGNETNINIRQNPSAVSSKIGQAQTGDLYEFVAINSGWYEIRLADGTTGFILAKYIQVLEGGSI